MLKHKHHIIPRYLKSVCPVAELTIELTVEEHAEAHARLYKQYGNHYDKLAWQMLNGCIGKEELHRELKKAYWVNWRKANPNYKDKWLVNNYVKVGWNIEARSKRMTERNKGQTGSSNFAAKKVIINSVEYGCVNDAAKALGVARQTIRKRIKRNQDGYAQS